MSKLREMPAELDGVQVRVTSGHTIEASGREDEPTGPDRTGRSCSASDHTPTPSVGGRLSPSLIRTVTVGSLQGIHRDREVRGSWAGGRT